MNEVDLLLVGTVNCTGVDGKRLLMACDDLRDKSYL